MLHVPDQTVLIYEEDGAPVGAFIGEEEGDGVFLSWTIMSKPGALPRALVEAIEHARHRWAYVTFFIPDNHPRCAALARLARERYRALPVESNDHGVYYRFPLQEARNGRITPESPEAERDSRSRGRGEQEESR